MANARCLRWLILCTHFRFFHFQRTKKLMGKNQKKPCDISTPWDFFLGPLRWWRHLFGAWRDLLSIKELMTWAGTSLHKEAITVMVIHLFPSRPSEIQEVLSQVKVREWIFFCPVWRDRSILYTHIWGHCYYEYVEYKQMHLKLHFCWIHVAT